MNKEQAQEMVEVLQNDYMETINKVIKKELGVNVKMRAVVSYGRCDNYVILENDDNSDVEKKMMSNKLLKHIFTSASLSAYAFNEDNVFSFRVSVYYTHPDRGSNGYTVLVFRIDKERKDVITTRKYRNNKIVKKSYKIE